MFGIITVALLLVVVVAISYFVVNTVQYVITSRRHLKQILKLPGRDPPHPFWGHTYDFPGPGQEGINFMYNSTFASTNEPLAKIQFGPFIGAVGMFHYDSLKHVLKTSEPKPLTQTAYKFLFPWLGDGLLLGGGKKWARNRRLLTPAFHFDILKPYMDINNECTDIFLNKMSKFGKTGEYFEVFQHVSLLTLDVILKCAFSYDIDCQRMGQQHPYVQAVTDLSFNVIDRIFKPWLYPDWTYYLTSAGRKFKKNCDYVHRVSDEIIHKRKEAFKQHGDSILRHHKYIDFLDILLKATDSDGQGLSDIDIRNEVDTFLFEGHDTTASGISWTLYSLAEHPDIQSKCQKEVDSIFEGKDTEKVSWDCLAKLPYLTMCIKEALRLHSPVPVIQRLLTKDMTIEGHFVPANTMVEINLYLLHHNPQIWKDSFVFQPERFSPENTDKMDPYQFAPFSAGPRNCIGQNFAMHEMKVVIAKILRRFTLEVDQSRDVKHQLQAVMKTEDGMYMKVIPRFSSN